MEEALVESMEAEFDDLGNRSPSTSVANRSPDISLANRSPNTNRTTTVIPKTSTPVNGARNKVTRNGKHVTSYDTTSQTGRTLEDESNQKHTPPTAGYVHQSGRSASAAHDDGLKSAVLEVDHQESIGISPNKQRCGSLEEGNTAQNVIMMYSPDIPSAESGYRGKEANLGNYYMLIETEESVKCIVSTALFLVILVAVILVALLQNPEM